MQFIDQAGCQECEPDFHQQVKQVSGVSFDRCYQCLTCSLGCPVAFAMDYTPNQVIRMVQLGLKQRVLSSSTIWLCSACETCATRCPNEVDMVRVMDTLRQMALREGIKVKETNIPIFHRTFLNGIRRFGRQHELSMLLFLKLKTRDFFSDLTLGIKMFWKGKLKLFPPRDRSAKEVKAIFDKAEREKSDE